LSVALEFFSFVFLGNSWLVSSPSALLFAGPRVFGLRSLRRFFIGEFPSSALRHHLSVFHSSCRIHLCPLSTLEATGQCTSLELPGPSAFPDPCTLLFTSPLKRRPVDSFALPTGSPAPRVWLPSQRPSVHSPSEASFSSQRSRASPSRALLLFHGRCGLSTSSLRSCASLKNLSAFNRRFSGFLP